MLRLNPVFAVALLIVIGVAAALVAHVRRPVPLQRRSNPELSPRVRPLIAESAPNRQLHRRKLHCRNSPCAAQVGAVQYLPANDPATPYSDPPLIPERMRHSSIDAQAELASWAFP